MRVLMRNKHISSLHEHTIVKSEKKKEIVLKMTNKTRKDERESTRLHTISHRNEMKMEKSGRTSGLFVILLQYIFKHLQYIFTQCR